MDAEAEEEYYDPRAVREEEAPPVEIPPERLSDDAMAGVIESYILREGTDYGAVEAAYDAKVAHIKKQLERGDIKIVFEPNSETVTLMTKRDFERRLAAGS